MDYKKTTLRMIEIAYRDVTGKDDKSQEELVEILDNTLTNFDIMPFESNDAFLYRLKEIHGVEDMSNLKTYTDMLTFDGKIDETSYRVIFRALYNSSNQTDITSETTDIEPDASLHSVDELEDVTGNVDVVEDNNININNKITTEKENINMKSPNEVLNALQASVPGGITPGGSNVTTVARHQAVSKQIEETTADRIEFSKNAIVATIVTAGYGKSEVASAGTSAMGTVLNPEKTLENFKKRLGYNAETGTYENIFNAEDVANAKAVHDLLDKAVNDPNYKVKPKFNDIDKEFMPTPKALQIEYKGETHLIKMSESAAYLAANSYGQVPIAGGKGAVQLAAAKQNQATKQKVASKTIQISNKATLLKDPAIADNFKDLTTTILTSEDSERPIPFTAEVSVAYKGVKKNAVEGDKPVKRNFQVRLNVEQKKQVTKEAYKSLEGASRGVVLYDMDNSDDLARIGATLSETLAILTADPEVGGYISGIRAAVAANEQAIEANKVKAAQASAGTSVSADDLD